MAEQKLVGHSRDRSLDGLRGLCALVVMIYHCVLVVPGLSIPADGSAGQEAASSPAWSLVWWLYRTPLRVLWAGPEAVLIFFVLSGFVLTLPLAGSGRHRWSAYYPRRLLRLYPPVWGAVVVAVVLAAVVPRSDTSGSVWLRGHAGPGPVAFGRDTTLLFGTSTVDGPLWSLRWEVWFSLLLPACFLALRWCASSNRWLPTIGLLAALSAWATADSRVRSIAAGDYLVSGLLQYLPVFGIGMVLASNVDRVRISAGRSLRGPRWVALAGLFGVVLLVSPSFPPATGDGFWAPMTAFLLLAGAVVIVVVSLCAPSVVGFLGSTALQWAGSRSFSIYLLHEPVIVAAALLVGAATPWPWLGVAVLAILAALLLAEVFFRLVERPAHRLSRRVGTSIGRPDHEKQR